VSPEGKASPRQLGVHHDGLVPGLKKMTEAVKESGGKIVLQIAHAGAFALDSSKAIAPSAFRKAKEMSLDDVSRVVTCFADAARRARDAGFDGVQIHAAHGYLLSQFLSPYFNKRSDAFGGNVQKRTRIVTDILRAIRQETGKDFPILIKINSEDFLDGGLTVDEMIESAKILEAEGIDAIELSGGTIISSELIPVRIHKRRNDRESPYYIEASRKLKASVSVPGILVGGIRSYEMSEKIVKDNIADFVAMSRPLIREPSLINRWQQGDRRPALCVSDNLCFKPAMQGEGLYCVREKKIENSNNDSGS
jgi:2,4-dienoyl-CoA reductase-like NADH-dependent reductase (Old Yellow Enzyme family)